MRPHVILFLAANPRGSHPLKLAEECSEIQRELKMAPHRDDFRFESRWAVGVDELMRHITELDPTVIHFSGHGGGVAGLVLQDAQGQPQAVLARALAMVIDTTARSARVVVLNACYSTEQADALRSKMDCIVGMDGAIGDEAARAFAIRFYGALGNRRSIGNAVDQGIAALAAKQLPDEVLPRCLTRDGIDAHKVLLGPLVAPFSPLERLRMGHQLRAHPAAEVAARRRAATRTARGQRDIGRRLPAVHAPVQAERGDAARVQALVREMHVCLLAGYAADAVIRAATVVEIALKTLAGVRPEAGVELGELIDDLRRNRRTELLVDASWLYQLLIATEQFAGQVRADRDRDGRRATEIAIRFALVTGLITEPEAAACQSSAAWQASELRSSALLRLDRATHRKALDDLLALPQRVLMVLVHGEMGQGHDHFAEIMTWRLRSVSNSQWREVVVKWPPPSPSLGARLAMLLDALARGMGVKLAPPAEDPATPEGALAWVPALAPIVAALAKSRERLLLRHVLRCVGTGPGGDDTLVDAYVRAIWANVATYSGERIIVGLDLRRTQRGLPMTRAWRIARAEFAAARAIEHVLDRHRTFHGALGIALPELTSVPVPDLVDWLRAEGGRNRDAAEAEARQLVSSTRGGRFDLVVQHLTAFNLDRHPEIKR